MTTYYDDEAIEAIIENLDRIPKKIESKIIIDELAEALYDKLRKKISV